MLLIKKYNTIIVLFMLTIHSFLMNGYQFVNRQLTVGTYYSSILAKADPSLFKNSIYIQAVNRTNERISIFYDLSPFIVTHFDFETFAIIQCVISIFFVIAGIYKLTKSMFGSPGAGYIAALLYTVSLNKWTLGSPSPYLNFFHHGLPYGYPLIIWSLVWFFQKRYTLSLCFAGIAWNFHPMSITFLLFAYFIYWLFNMQEFSLGKVAKGICAFVVPAFPILVRSFIHLGVSGGSSPLWLEGVRWVSWYSNFPSMWPLSYFAQASLFFLLFLLSVFQIENQAVRKWILTFAFAVLLMCLIATVFAEFYPVHLLVKLSLWRSTTIYLFLAIPCIAYMFKTVFNHSSIIDRFVVITLAVILSGYFRYLPWYYASFFIVLLALIIFRERIKVPHLKRVVPLLFCALLFATLVYQKSSYRESFKLALLYAATLMFLLALRWGKEHLKNVKSSTFTIATAALFIAAFDCGILYDKGGPEIYYHGTCQGKIDPWADIQRVAQKYSEKDDLFIVPPYMNDFTTYSQRAVLGDWAEGCTVIFFDDQFAREWFARMHDLRCKPYSWFNEYNDLTTEEIRTAAKKYKAKFVITEKPKTFDLKKIYENKKFILYRID